MFIWNAIGFSDLKKQAQLSNENLNDSKYWELNINMNLQLLL